MWSNFLFFALMIWFVLVQTKAQDLAHLQNVKSQYLVELANEVNNQSLFFSFKEKINSFVTNNKFTDEDLLDEIKKLNEGLENFTSVIDKVDTDSLLVLFFPLYLYSNNLMITSLTRDLLSGSGQKIILFATSLSCECTMASCRKEAVDLINLSNEYKYEYLIIDSYFDNTLNNEYGTRFVPSVVLLEKDNNPVFKLQSEDDLVLKAIKHSIN